MNVLMIGGTGPSGIPIVRRLVDHGHEVTILHRGTHERPETPAQVPHIHADPYDEDVLRGALGASTWDVVVAMYGRLRWWLVSPKGVVATSSRSAACPRISVGPTPGCTSPPVSRFRCVRTRPWSTILRSTRRGTASCAPRRRCLPRTPASRTFATPTCTARTNRRRANGRWSAASSTVAAASSSPTRASRCTTTATRRTARLQSCSESSIPNAARERSSTSPTRNAHDPTSGGAVRGRVGRRPGDRLYAVRAGRTRLAAARATAADHRVLDLTRLHEQLGHRVSCPRAMPFPGRRAGSPTTRPRRGIEERVLTDPFDYAAEDALMDSWLAARRAVVVPDSRSSPGGDLPTAGRRAGRACTRSSKHE